MRGKTGARGPVGPPGAAGTGGGKESIAVWDVHQDASSSTNVTITSSDNVSTGTQVEVVKLTVTGEFPGCDSGSAEVRKGVQSLGSTGKRSGQGWLPELQGGGRITSDPTPLNRRVLCRDGMGDTRPVPAFDASVTLALTERNTTATSTFD